MRDVPRNCLMNGITARGDSLYLACTHIHQGEHSLLPDLFGDIRKIDQNFGCVVVDAGRTGLSSRFLVKFICESFLGWKQHS